jgi:hypothetical protein
MSIQTASRAGIPGAAVTLVATLVATLTGMQVGIGTAGTRVATALFAFSRPRRSAGATASWWSEPLGSWSRC